MKHLMTLAALLVVFSFSAQGSETVEGLKKDYQTFKQKMNVELEEIDKKLEKLAAESKKKGEKTKESAAKDLEVTKKNLEVELEQMKEASATKWQKFKKVFAKSVDSLNNKVQKALSDEPK